MTVNVVLDHPRRHRAQRLRRSLSTLVGGLLLCIGLIAAIVALPAGVVALFVDGLFIFGLRPRTWPG